MSTFLPLTTSGLCMGLIYAMLGMGLVLLMRAVGVMNFAQGDLMVIGAYVSYWLTNSLHLPVIPMVFCCIVIFSVNAAIFMYGCYMPVRNSKWSQSAMICTLGADMIIREALVLIFGAEYKTAEPLLPGLLKVGPIVLEWQYIAVIILSLIIIWAVFTLFDKMYVGKAMMAASQDRYAAQLLGIPINLTIYCTYMIVMIICGLAGWLVAPLFLVSTTLSALQIKVFAGMIIGGLGSLKGAVLGCIIIGLVEAYSTYVTNTYKDVVVFGALLLMLMIRPQGLMGESIAEKA